MCYIFFGLRARRMVYFSFAGHASSEILDVAIFP